MFEQAIYLLLSQLGEIFFFIVLPIMLLAGMGYLLGRRMNLNMPTLSVLNFHFFIPAMIYFSLVNSTVKAGEVAMAIIFSFTMIACLAGVSYLTAMIRGIKADQRHVFAMTVMFHNSGNFGLSLQDLAFGPPGRALQVFYLLAQTISNFTLGVFLAAIGRPTGPNLTGSALKAIARMPPLYAIAAALVTIQARQWWGDVPGLALACQPFWKAIGYIQQGFVPTALLTLGAQLATLRHDGPRYPVRLSVVLRLLLSPALGLFLTWLMGLNGFLAQVLVVSTATPSAINPMLFCLEFDNHPDLAAKAVFYSTLLSPLTITLVVFLAQSNLLPHLVY